MKDVVLSFFENDAGFGGKMEQMHFPFLGISIYFDGASHSLFCNEQQWSHLGVSSGVGFSALISIEWTFLGMRFV